MEKVCEVLLEGQAVCGGLLGNLLPSGQGLEWPGEEPWLLKTNQR